LASSAFKMHYPYVFKTMVANKSSGCLVWMPNAYGFGKYNQVLS